MNKILLDTNAYSALSKADIQIRRVVEDASIVYVSVITLGELYRGFKLGSREKENITLLAGFLKDSTTHVLDVYHQTAQEYTRVSITLAKQGTPIPVNDMWIAAQTLETRSVLITYDTHFLHIPKLPVWPGLKNRLYYQHE